MTFAFPNQGTCSRMTKIELAPDHTIQSVEVVGGCNGNLKGISSLLKGMKAEDAIARMEGVTWGPSPPAAPTRSPRTSKRPWPPWNSSSKRVLINKNGLCPHGQGPFCVLWRLAANSSRRLGCRIKTNGTM